jgi:hypothetical protein
VAADDTRPDLSVPLDEMAAFRAPEIDAAGSVPDDSGQGLPAAPERSRDRAGASSSDEPYRIAVLSWFDVFVFDDPPTITCPDCGEVSPELRDVWAAVRWADKHQRECAA